MIHQGCLREELEIFGARGRELWKYGGGAGVVGNLRDCPTAQPTSAEAGTITGSGGAVGRGVQSGFPRGLGEK